MCRRSGEATIGSVEVSVRIHDDGVDGQQLDDLTRRLRDELIELDVAVDGVRTGDAPAGARSIELAAVGTLLVTLSQSAVLVPFGSAGLARIRRISASWRQVGNGAEFAFAVSRPVKLS
jgi:hypothetical protein